jgi:hypothetical protein
MTDFNKDRITIIQFCDIQGVPQVDRFGLISRYKDTANTYEKWYGGLSKMIRLGAKKDFGKVDMDFVRKINDNRKAAIQKRYENLKPKGVAVPADGEEAAAAPAKAAKK